MSKETPRCARHDTPLPPVCPSCLEDYKNAPDPATMTGDERAAELERIITDPLSVPFDTLWTRADALVGRGIFTHEFAYPDHLYAEARERSGRPPTINELIDVLPEEHRKKVIPVIVGGPTEEESVE